MMRKIGLYRCCFLISMLLFVMLVVTISLYGCDPPASNKNDRQSGSHRNERWTDDSADRSDGSEDEDTNDTSDSDESSDSNDAIGDLDDIVIDSDTTWKNTTIEVNGTITVTDGATLTLDNCELNLNPEVEDTESILLDGGSFIAMDSTLQSGSGKQWNLEAFGDSIIEFQDTSATDHTGIRAFDNTQLSADNSEIEEVQCHDNATLKILNGSAVYLVLFFDNTGSTVIPEGMLVAGDAIDREFTYKSTAKAETEVKGTIIIEDSDVWGYQLDLEGNSALTVDTATEIVLALHLDDVGTIDISQNITSMTSGSIDFSAKDGPRFDFTNTQISFINTYVGGKSDVTFSGSVKVIEGNVWDDAKLTFGNKTKLVADLAQSYDTAELVLNGVTLITDYSSPSITAMDMSFININNVNAISGTMVYATENGRVNITGGSNWKKSMFETMDNGKITYTP